MSELTSLAESFLQACRKRDILVATAESCTGGMIIALLTDLPGASSMVDRGFVTYSNDAKTDMLGVSEDTLQRFGAVSGETARAMAAGALERSRASLAISVTGIAGPDGGSEEKPVGLVWFGVAVTGREPWIEKKLFENHGRDAVRSHAVRHALTMGLLALGETQAVEGGTS